MFINHNFEKPVEIPKSFLFSNLGVVSNHLPRSFHLPHSLSLKSGFFILSPRLPRPLLFKYNNYSVIKYAASTNFCWTGICLFSSIL